ncbi:MAG: bacteriophytochrome (light-regulated signal transduction histidine kinase), partial [Xanthobacteraceae bacterium]
MATYATSLTRPGLRGILTGTLAVLTAALILSVTAVVVWTATRETQRSIGRSLGDLAAFMRESLESDVFERWRSTRTLATLPAFTNPGGSYQGRRAILDRVKSNVTETVWIGFADLDGRVRVASGAVGEDTDVSHRRWFAAARDRPPPAAGGADRPTIQSTPGERVVEIGVHVRDANGGSVGIMGV